jgi:ABC-type transport system involved in cytochrome c biogenesis permease subunit
MKKRLLIAAILIIAAIVILIAMPPEKTLGARIRLIYLHAAIAESAIVCFVLAAAAAISSLASPAFSTWTRPFFSTALRLWGLQLLLGALAMKCIWGAFLWTEPKVRVALILFLFALCTELLLVATRSRAVRFAGCTLTGMMALYTFFFTSDIFHPNHAILRGDSPVLSALFIALSFIVLTLSVLLAERYRARGIPPIPPPVNPASS